ncbi:MAG: hypothetical protein AAGA65_09165 [Actinomycetota bacterium]
MGVGSTVKQGDTAPDVRYQLLNDPAWGERVGKPINLSDATQVAVVFRHEPTRSIVHSAVAAIDDKANGKVSTPLTTEITAKPGLVSFEWVVTWEGGAVTTFPSGPRTDLNYILVRRELPMPDSIPVPPTNAVNDHQEFSVEAAETISALRVVAMVDGKAVLYQPDGSTPDVFGVTRTAAAVGDQVIVVPDGVVDSPGAGLTPAATYWAGVNGTLVDTPPTSGVLLVIGYAADADSLVVQVGEPVNRA